ncbi:MAG: malic enzyme-like NAD(P)-binding protein [Patescibacteria group bacterium]|jgi:malate dehydrogenase (oxaloacetate-decarboxylating)(NADP+)
MKQAALRYHEKKPAGKIGMQITKPCTTQHDLALAYTPGVAEPVKAIVRNPALAYRYTNKANLVAVISNGTAVLGLGNTGALASKPVMEGKCVLFKKFAGIDAIDLEINERDPKKFINIVASLADSFGGINLEDIAAPACFEIEQALKKRCSIPVFHDDQHGTAIVSGAALLNALALIKKDIKKIRVVFSGAGAAGTACKNFYIQLGVKPQNIKVVNKQTISKLAGYLIGADVFVGLSVANIVTSAMLKSMAANPIVFALANPDPEISYELAKQSRPDIILATGRSDRPNQINNVLGFPFIFRAALDVRATTITEHMKLAATYALAKLAHQPVPKTVLKAYKLKRLSFSKDYLLPKPFDPRLLVEVSSVVAKAANKSINIKIYRKQLEKLAQV